MTRPCALRVLASAAMLAAGPFAALAQPILIPLSPQTRDQPPPRPSPAPIAPPQADATDVPPTAAGPSGVVPGAQGTGAVGAQGTARGEPVEPGPIR